MRCTSSLIRQKFACSACHPHHPAASCMQLDVSISRILLLAAGVSSANTVAKILKIPLSSPEGRLRDIRYIFMTEKLWLEERNVSSAMSQCYGQLEPLTKSFHEVGLWRPSHFREVFFRKLGHVHMFTLLNPQKCKR